MFFLSHRLVLLPRSLEVHAAVFSALDDRPSTAGCFHVAIHLRNSKEKERGGWEKHIYEDNATLKARQWNRNSVNSIFSVALTNNEDSSGQLFGSRHSFFPAFMMIHLWECNVSVSSSDLIGISLSFTNSLEMFLISGPCFYGIKVEVRTGHIPADTWV